MMREKQTIAVRNGKIYRVVSGEKTAYLIGLLGGAFTLAVLMIPFWFFLGLARDDPAQYLDLIAISLVVAAATGEVLRRIVKNEGCILIPVRAKGVPIPGFHEEG